MKKVGLILALMVPAWLYSCTGAKPPTLTPTEVIDRGHDAFPKVPEFTRVPAEEFEQDNPTPKPAKKHGHNTHRVARPVPHPRPHVGKAPVETLPPQQGPICIFPLNQLPNCTPQVAQ